MFLLPAATLAVSLLFTPPTATVGVDPLTDPATEHKVAVGSVVGTNGYAYVSAFQVGRYFGDAAAAMGFATSYDGFNWHEGLLPGITRAQSAQNPHDRVTFPTVAYDSRHATWLISTLAIDNLPNGDDQTLPPQVSRSSDGFHWSNPIAVATGGSRPEKNWLACDNNYRSPYFGTCYVAWDDNGDSDRFHVNVSTDGGQTWGPTKTAADGHGAYGADIVIQPNGTVVVTTEDGNGYDGIDFNIISFVSKDGGNTWSAAYEVSPISAHTVAANMRTQPLPTAGVTPDGTVYTIWQDCRFRTGCTSNDLVLSTSKDGMSWTAPQRIPLDSATSGADHFLPTLSINSGFFGNTLGLTYYYYPQANCTTSTCALDAAFSTSHDGGQTWSSPQQTAGPMNVTWLATTSAGYMVGDYFTSVFPFFDVAPNVVATAPTGGSYNEYVQLPLFLGGWNFDAHGTKRPHAAAHDTLRAAPRSAFLPARLAPHVRHASHRHPM